MNSFASRSHTTRFHCEQLCVTISYDSFSLWTASRHDLVQLVFPGPPDLCCWWVQRRWGHIRCRRRTPQFRSNSPSRGWSTGLGRLATRHWNTRLELKWLHNILHERPTFFQALDRRKKHSSTKQDKLFRFSPHLSSFLNAELFLFKCRYVAWQRGLPRKFADCVFVS